MLDGGIISSLMKKVSNKKRLLNSEISTYVYYDQGKLEEYSIVRELKYCSNFCSFITNKNGTQKENIVSVSCHTFFFSYK